MAFTQEIIYLDLRHFTIQIPCKLGCGSYQRNLRKDQREEPQEEQDNSTWQRSASRALHAAFDIRPALIRI